MQEKSKFRNARAWSERYIKESILTLVGIIIPKIKQTPRKMKDINVAAVKVQYLKLMTIK